MARRRQLAGQVAQHHLHRQQRAVVPVLWLRRVATAFFARHRRGEGHQVGAGQTERFAGHRQRDDGDERALAAARAAEQHQRALGVQHVERRQVLRCVFGGCRQTLCRAPAHGLGLAALGQQRRVHRRQPHLGLGAVAGEERQLVGLLQDSSEVGAAQILPAGAGPGRLLDQHAEVDGAAVVAADRDAPCADRQRIRALRDGAGPCESCAEAGSGGVESGLVDGAGVERPPEVFKRGGRELHHD